MRPARKKRATKGLVIGGLVILVLVVVSRYSGTLSSYENPFELCTIHAYSPLERNGTIFMAVGEETIITASSSGCNNARIRIGTPPIVSVTGPRGMVTTSDKEWNTSIIATGTGRGEITIIAERDGEPIARDVLGICVARNRMEIESECGTE